MASPFDHPVWCRCKRCLAEDREQERAALKGVPVQEPDPPPVVLAPYAGHWLEMTEEGELVDPTTNPRGPMYDRLYGGQSIYDRPNPFYD
jgi:hypothetical protein